MSQTDPVSRWRWLVAPGEGRALFAAASAYFLLLGGYYMLRSLREAFALEVGREHIASLFYVTFAVMLAILPLYWFIVARLPRQQLFPVIYSAVVLLFVGLAVAIAMAPPSASISLTRCPLPIPPIDGLHDIWPRVSILCVSNSVRHPNRALARAASVPACPPPITIT